MARWFPAGFQKGVDIDGVDSAIDMPYDIPNFHVEFVRAEPPAVPTGFWRGVGPNNNVFAIEFFMDELAKKAGKDPVDFRRGMLGKNPRLLAALNLAAEKSGWGQPLPARVGRGVSVQPSFASFIATVVEAEVDEQGEVNLRRVTCAVDTGIAVNPDTVMAQLEGGLIFGLTAALYGEITIDKGRVQQSNFHDYRMLRIDQAPKIEVHVIKSGEAPGGIGETGVDRGTAGAAQRDLCRDRRRAAPAADRPGADSGEKSMSPRRASHSPQRCRRSWRSRWPSASGSSAAPARWHSRMARKWRWRITRPPIPPAFRPRSPRRASSSAAHIWRRRRTAWSATPRKAARNMPAVSAFKLPFGTLYSTNITPDKETGIGNYSDQDFLNAVHRGIRRDGARLYPAMPFTSYTYMTDADALAIKAYLFSLPPVRAAAPANTLMFPFNQRWAMIFWSALFNPDTPLRAGHLEKPGMEQGRLSRGSAGALRRMPYAAKPGVRAQQPQEIRRRADGRLARLQYQFRQDHRRRRLERRRSRRPICRPVMPSVTAPLRDRWAKRSTRASASWRRKTSAPLWPICAACPPIASPDLPATLAPPAPASHRDGGDTRTRAARWCSKAPASVATAGPAKARSRPSPR